MPIRTPHWPASEHQEQAVRRALYNDAPPAVAVDLADKPNTKACQETQWMPKVFISYCHKQGEWVWDRLLPVLKAGGAEVLIDRERFEAGKAIEGQMDAKQDEADRHVLVLSPDYLNSAACKHEMNRAIDLDPAFDKGIVLPIIRVECRLPSNRSRKSGLGARRFRSR